MICSTVKLILLATTATSIFLILFISFASSSCNSIERVRKPRSGISDQLLAHHSADHKLLENAERNFAYGLALWNSTNPRRKPNWRKERYSNPGSVLKYLGALLEN
ncbi:hypothetical protein M514_02979 [Trichuris suis]|uniref:Uncharacterized protein n=1 Tax=Trichuris suis TaxID=68888 RepID=A0A085MQG6_9BILA|nr:hypothetical protein M514_02979 [Trichuris suis]